MAGDEESRDNRLRLKGGIELTDVDGKQRAPEARLRKATGERAVSAPMVRLPGSALFEGSKDTPLDLSDVPSRTVEPPAVAGVVAHGRRRMSPVRALGVVAFVGAAAAFLWLWQSGELGKLLDRAGFRSNPAADPGDRQIYRSLDMGDAVLVDIDVQPRSARLLLDGLPLPSNPLRLPRGAMLHRISAMADGFGSLETEFRADRAQTVRLRLKRAR